MRFIGSIIIAVLLALTSCVCYAEANEDMRNAVGMSVIGFSALDTNGNTVTSDIIADTTMTVINEWATWCGPCVNEMPHFQTMHEYYSSTPEGDVQILGCIYVSGDCTPASAKQFLEQHGYTWTNVVEDSVLGAVFNNSSSIPNTIIVDRNGIVRDMHTGSFSSAAQLQSYIESWYETLHAEESEEPIMPGDIDGDGMLSVSDALSIMRMAIGVMDIPDMEVADFDGSGNVDITDAVLVLRNAMGIS